MRTVGASFLREILSAAASPEILSLAGGLPRTDLFPVDAIDRASRAVLADRGATALQYSVTSGEPELREWIAQRLAARHGVRVTPEQILITTGSQQALDLCGKLFSDERMAIENPGYLGALLAFRAVGHEPLPIRMDAAGANAKDLAAAAKAGARVLYTMSRFRNPTGASLDGEARARLVEWVVRRRGYLIEDDPYGELDFEAEIDLAEPIAAIAPDRVIYCGSFSKSIAPSLRIGFVAAPQEVVTGLTRLKQAADLHTSGFLQLILSELLAGGWFDIDDHLALIRRRYREQRDALLASLRRHIPDCEIDALPSGGMFLWVSLGESTSTLLERALERGVAFVPGRHFYLDRNPPDYEVRLNFSALTPSELDEAVSRIADCRTGSPITTVPAPARAMAASHGDG